MMPSKSPWTKLLLSTSLVNELNVWKDAFSAVRGRNVTYSEMFDTLLSHMPETEPEIMAEFERMGARNPEIFNKIGKYRRKG